MMDRTWIKVAKGLVALGAIVLPVLDSHLQAKELQFFMNEAVKREVAEALKKK